MASSPTSSSCSSLSFHSPPNLPVMALRDKIVEKIQGNRVTLIVGDTGCGKSSQVPQFLLEENVEPIVCTQPRRFAVVAIASMVARARNCEVGGEVGFHIGHLKVLTPRSKIVFKTAGVLLDEMLDKGIAALRYKVIILDEVHERSVESDLVLACVKQFMLRDNSLRVVLMSATAEISRYKDYFKDLGRGERVEVLAIPSLPQQTIFQRKVLYLEQVTELLGKNSESSSDGYCSGLSHCSANADMKPEEHQLIHDLVMHIHESETDVEKSILVFLPTYFSLEQQWTLLKPLAHFKVHILHRSIDTEQALMSMKICKSHRKVILATNIAESSVTIPGVAFVIDSCRSLQVFWDTNRKKDATELVWVSKSQAEQRKGRTGRTCDGQIYRLVTRSFFNSLNEHERPAILNLSLRHQVLTICCAESKAINDPRVLLQKAMDPPDPEVVEDALSLLAHVHALEKTVSHRGRYEPTFYGRLLASLPLSFDASVIVLKFGEIGLLREGILIGTLVDQLPLPILHPFGDQHLYIEYLDKYFEGTAVHGGRKEVALMGNLCAFQFWQRVFKDKHRLEQLKQLVEVHEPKSTTQSVMLKIEQEWCHFHNLVQTSLHRVSEIYEDVLNAMHRFRPKFLAMANGLPSYYDPYEFKHTCLLHSQPSDVDALANDDTGLSPAVTSCVALPFVAPKQFQADAVAENLAAVIKEIRVQFTEDTSLNQNQSSSGLLSHVTDETSLCRFFMNGLCNKGSQCVFSHSLQAKRPICKFFLSFEGCRNGDSCFFSHDCGTTAPIHDSPSYCLPEDEVAEAALLLDLLPTTGDGCILVIDDTNLHFSSNLSHHCNPTSIVATTSKPYSSSDASAMGLTVLSCDPLHSIITNEGEITIPWREVLCALWFAQFTVDDEDFDVQRRLVQKFFEFLAIRILADTLYDVQVIITMNNSRFAQLQVERLGRECFFFLSESFPFDESTFGEFSDRNSTKRPLTVSRPVSYVFNMQPPTDLQFGDYSSALNKCLYNNQ
ncbi:DExH-box ATP-dependent RNA helicase DExH8 isoform X2 [Magnolia sinica]|uniref:DExH-box ATP-dependent RNA helicase DExH8 isoform X2 n=1 Tax=Magnolia sinica TaxID=86752 RepID=UPI00265856FE|nr:DExH-box ATP-dependent RNA helicase DExH8 isoform X2 [Magnolia sinica]